MRLQRSGWIAAVVLLLGGGALSLWWQPGEADVYQSFERRLETLAQLLPGRVGSGEPRLYVINGQAIGVEIERARATPAQLIDTAARYREAKQPQGSQSTMRDFAGDGWRALAEFSTDVVHDGFGMPHPELVVLAIDDPSAGFARVWTLRFPDDLDLVGLLGEPPAAALDRVPLDGITPWPGAKPVFQLSEYSEFATGHLVVYEGGGSIAAHHAHFLQTLARGLGTAPVELAAPGPDGGGVIQAADETREVAVYSDAGGESVSRAGTGTVLDLIQIRELR